MNINNNKGMYIESLINRTINYLNNHNIAYIEKRNVPYKIFKIINNNVFLGNIYSKSTVDYTGVYLNHHIEFEAKQTASCDFDLRLIKNHQFNFLKNMYEKQNCICFLIIQFYNIDETYLLPIQNLIEYCAINKKKIIPYCSIVKMSYRLEIIFPGILNLTDCLQQSIENMNQRKEGKYGRKFKE